MWDTFWRVVIFTALICALVTCVSCATKGKSEAEDLIETAGESGCVLKSIKFRDGQLEQIDCHPRYLR